MSCPICCNNIFEELIDFGIIPQSGLFLDDINEDYKKIHLIFEFCNKCGFIRQKEKIKHDYKEDKERTWQKLPDYSLEIINSFKENKEELILEIGSNVGLFLDVLKENGFNNILGIEPSIPASNISKEKGHKTENAYFDNKVAEKIKEKYGLPGIVVMRHVLEHIEEPFGFLVSLRGLLKDNGTLFLEVPNAKNIISNLRAQELWDEHFNYFSSDNLKLLVNRAGFKVNKVLIKPYFGEEAILLWCSKSDDINEKNNCEEFVEECRSFERRLKEFYNDLLDKVKNSKKPVIGIGAAHKQTNLLVFSKIGDYVERLIDDDEYKIKKYVPVPKLIPIISTKDFLNEDFSGTIIRTAFGFENWMDKICNSKNADIIEVFS